MHSDEVMPGAILSCNVVATHGFSSHNCITKKVNKQVEAKIRRLGIKEQKCTETREQLKIVKQGWSRIH